MTKKNDKLVNLKTTIIRLLNKTEVYKPELAYQVELAASSILAFRKIRDEVLKDDTPITVSEKSRENNERVKINPVIEAMIKMGGVARRDLAALYMNRELKRDIMQVKDVEADPLQNLVEKIDNL